MATAPVAPIDLSTLDLGSFQGRPVAVLGLARSGLALTRFLADRGANVTAYDTRPAAELATAIEALEGRPARLLLGPDIDPRQALEGQAMICTSPSVSTRFPTTEPRLRAALAAVESGTDTPIVSEVDLFLRLVAGTTIGVTGTKGKTTTSALTAAVLEAGDAPIVLGGNIGIPLIERMPQLTQRHRIVLELSELQLPTLSRGTDVAVYTHVTSDHLDRHGSLENYRLVKKRLGELLPPGGVLVRNLDDEIVASYAAPPDARTLDYRLAPPADDSVGIDDGWIVANGVRPLPSADPANAETRHPDVVEAMPIMPLAEIPIPGQHNISNVLAAVSVGLLFGVSASAIRAAVASFPGVEHRLESVATIDGVRYVNDSQGTQPDAVIAALNSFPKPLVLIAGGRSKGVPVGDLAAAAASRASAAVLIGETAPELATAFRAAGLENVERAESMEEAVEVATRIARRATPSIVLLSPAAASFDMFTDYEARGAAFKSAVRSLAPSAGQQAAR